MRTLRFSALAGTALMIAGLAPAAGEEFRVGLLLPYSGVYAALGQEIDDGFVLALDLHGGDIPEHSIEVIREDTEVDPAVGLSKARKLVLQDEVIAIVGIVSSGVLGAIRDFVHQSETPLIVANAGNDEATGERCSPFITRVSFSNSQVNRPMGQWMFDHGVETVYTLAPDYAAGHQMMDTFAAAFTEAGGTVVGQAFTPFQTTQDFGPYLTTAKSAGPDAIFVFYAGGEAISFVKQYDSFGLKDEIPLYGSGFLTSPLYVNAQGPAAEGVVASLHYVPTIDTPENAAFVEAFQAAYDRVPSEYAVQGFDAARALIESIRGGATDRAALAEALAQASFVGPRGPLQIDPATNNVVQNIYIYETVAGEGGLTQSIVDVIEEVRDPVNGCVL
ncbi:MAG: ABC transporter substrate-binding protein [Alphaproteobacteria bacterium]